MEERRCFKWDLLVQVAGVEVEAANRVTLDEHN